MSKVSEFDGPAPGGDATGDDAPAKAVRFDAFISYRRSDGTAHAERLRQWLEEYELSAEVRNDRAVGGGLTIYQDTAYERATEDFFAKEIRPALLASNHLIVIGTPDALKPRGDGKPNWVEREVEEFLTIDPPRPIFAAIAIGGLEDPLPAGLGTTVLQQMERVDIRDLTAFRRYWPSRSAGLESELLKIVAALFHVPRDQMPILRQEAARRRAQRAWTYAAIAAAVAIVLVGMLIWSIVSLVETRRQLVQYTTLQGIATFARSPARARLYFAKTRELAANWFDQATGVSSSVADSWLGRSYPDRIRTILWHDNAVRAVDFSPDGARIGTSTTRGDAFIWDVKTGNKLVGPLRHDDSGSVNWLEFSPDGQTLLTAGSDHTVRLWSVKTGKPVATLKAHAGPVMKAIYGAQGSIIVSGALSDEVCVWKASGEKRFCVLHSATEKKGVLDVAVHPGGELIASVGSNGTLRLWSVKDGTPVGPAADHDDTIQSLAFNPNGKSLATASYDDTVRIWTIPDLQPAIRDPLRHGGRVESVVFDSTGDRLVTASANGRARVWNAAFGTPRPDVREMSHTDSITKALFDSRGTHVLTICDDGRAQVWDAMTGFPLGNPIEHADRVIAAAFSDSGDLAATGSFDGTVRVFEVPEHEGPSVLHSTPTGFERLGFCPDGSCIVASTLGGHWWLFDGKSGTLRAHEKLSGNVSALAFHPAGDLFATGTNDGHVRVWQASSGRASSAWLSYKSAISDLQFDPSGHEVAIATEGGEVALWSVATGTVARRFNHSKPVTSISFDRAAKRLLTATDDGVVRIWDIAASTVVETVASVRVPIERVAFTARDNRVVVIPRAEPWVMLCSVRSPQPDCTRLQRSDAPVTGVTDPSARRVAVMFPKDAVQVWNTEDGVFAGPAIEGVFSAIAIDASGGRVATGSNGEVQVWDVETGQPLGATIYDEAFIHHLAFSPRGDWLVAGHSSRLRLITLAKSPRASSDERRAAERETAIGLDPATGTPRRLSAAEWASSARSR